MKKLTGRKYGFFEEYMMDDAEVALVVIGSSAGTGKEAVDRLRAEGKKVGLIKLRVFRPFPRVPLAEAMCKVKAVAIMDKAESFSNSGGPLFNEARNSLYDLPNKPYAINYIYGLGGRDITVEDYYEIYNDLFIIYETDDPGDVYRYVGVRDSRYARRRLRSQDRIGIDEERRRNHGIQFEKRSGKTGTIWPGVTDSAPDAAPVSPSAAFCVPWSRKTRRSSPTPPAVWKFPRLSIHIQHITTATSTRRLPTQRRPVPAWKRHISVLKKKGKVKDNFKFITFGGDGGTYDIGLQSLSGAMERGHDMVYVCYDNEAYMNTGIQRSSSTPRFADATTSPAGKVIPGKQQNKKNLTEIIAAHNVPYAAQTTFIGNFKDLHEKAHKAIYTEGPCFLNVLSPCPRGWRYDTPEIAEICRLAVETCVWPLYEIVEGVWKLSYEPKKKLPVEEFLKKQGRFAHMFKKGNDWMVDEAQEYVDKQWDKLLAKCE